MSAAMTRRSPTRGALAAACVMLVFATGCGDIALTRSGPRQPRREATCDFAVYTAPVEGFVEIGVIDVTIGSWMGENRFENVSEFKEAIRPLVCDAGGDAVLGFANGHGFYIKGSVLKRAPSPVNPAAIPSAAADVGCHYDTQCKGDRICVGGTCVAPSAPAPASAPSSAPAAP